MSLVFIFFTAPAGANHQFRPEWCFCKLRLILCFANDHVALHLTMTQSSFGKFESAKLLLQDCRLCVTADDQSNTPKDTLDIPRSACVAPCSQCFAAALQELCCSLPSTCVFLHYSLEPILRLHGSFQLQRSAKDKLYVRAPV